jgi:hypothetical protein
MYDNDEDWMPPRDEIEDPIYETEMPERKKQEIRTIGENIHRALMGLCQDVEEGRFPLFRKKPLIGKTRESKVEDVLFLARGWIHALEKEKLHRNPGAVCWTKFLEVVPNLFEGDIAEEVEEWTYQLRKWRN